jgi:hypothetical protein
MDTPSIIWHGPRITSWAQFHRKVKPGRKLLARLEDFADPVLIAGCQRSGTTAVARMLYQAEGVGRYRFGKDDELDAALLLSGYAEMPIAGRGVFQTTYLNDRVFEYFEHERFRLVWILREPASVIYSMLFNWRRGALTRLYDACGRDGDGPSRGPLATAFKSRFDKACAAYLAKTRQTFELVERLGPDRVFVADYNELVLNKDDLIPRIFSFARLPFRAELLASLHAKSVRRAPWSERRAERIETLCQPVYEQAKTLAAQVSAS